MVEAQTHEAGRPPSSHACCPERACWLTTGHKRQTRVCSAACLRRGLAFLYDTPVTCFRLRSFLEETVQTALSPGALGAGHTGSEKCKLLSLSTCPPLETRAWTPSRAAQVPLSWSRKGVRTHTHASFSPRASAVALDTCRAFKILFCRSQALLAPK